MRCYKKLYKLVKFAVERQNVDAFIARKEKAGFKLVDSAIIELDGEIMIEVTLEKYETDEE